jgi:acyl-CoA thioester hydrolase
MTDKLPITYRGLVYPWHCDHMGHMNVMWYVGKFDEATWQLVRLFGATNEYMKREQRGMVAGEQRILYKRELVAGNNVCVRSGIIEVREKVIRFFHEMINEDTGEIAAVTFLTGVHIDSQLRRACALPEAMRMEAQKLVTDYLPA